jgi:hypothetical protein
MVNWASANPPARREVDAEVKPWRISVSYADRERVEWQLTSPGCKNVERFKIKPEDPATWPFPDRHPHPTRPNVIESGAMREDPDPRGDHKYTIEVLCEGLGPDELVVIDPDMDVDE